MELRSVMGLRIDLGIDGAKGVLNPKDSTTSDQAITQNTEFNSRDLFTNDL